MAGLAKAGLVRYFNRALLHGPSSHFGLQIADAQFTAITNQLETLCRHGPLNTMTGKLICLVIEALKVEIGWGGDLFSIPTEVLQELGSDCWVKSLVIEAKKHKLHLYENTSTIHRKRQQDKILMERLWAEGYIGLKLATLNKCRIWMKATTKADLTMGNGRRLLPGILSGVRPCVPINQTKFPTQGPINEHSWDLWKQAIRKILARNKHWTYLL